MVEVIKLNTCPAVIHIKLADFLQGVVVNGNPVGDVTEIEYRDGWACCKVAYLPEGTRIISHMRAETVEWNGLMIWSNEWLS